MSTGGFQRVTPLGDGAIRGPARVLVEPYTGLWPANLSKIINLAESGYTTEEQELGKFSEEPESGKFYLGFASYATKALEKGATAAEVQAALEALPSIGTGGVKCTEGPLKEKAILVKFAGELAEKAQPLIVVAKNELKKGEKTPTIAITRKTAGFGKYDPVGEWTELGSTKGGVKINRNNTESLIDIDQIQAAITALPDQWEMSVDAPMAETTLENLQLAWEGGEITSDVTQSPNERHLGMGNPLSYTERRLAVIHRRNLGTSAGKIFCAVFRRVTRAPSSSMLEFQKTGNLSTINQTFRCFADSSVADPKYSMGEFIVQQYI
jgi:hypothetical protein